MLTTENHKWFKVVGIKISFEHVDSWAKSLLFRTHHLWNSTTELTLLYLAIEIDAIFHLLSWIDTSGINIIYSSLERRHYKLFHEISLNLRMSWLDWYCIFFTPFFTAVYNQAWLILQTTYVLKNRLSQQSFLNRDSFLNRAFLNRECTVSIFSSSCLCPVLAVLVLFFKKNWR